MNKILASFNKNTILAIRTSENKGRLAGCLTGWLDDSLSDYGKKQAEYLSLNLFHELEKNHQVNILSSDMKRSKQCSDICLAYKTPNIEVSSILRDINYGEHEGYFYDGLSADSKTELSNQNYIFSKGESYLDVKFRVVYFLNNKLKNLKNKSNIIFSHNIFLKSLITNKKYFNNDLYLFDMLVDNNSNTKEISSILNTYKIENYKKTVDEKYFQVFDDIINQFVSLREVYTLPDLDNN